MKGLVVVIDAADGAGRGVVEAAVEARRPVVAISGDAAELALLRQRFAGADLTTLSGSIADEESATLLAIALRDLDRPITGIVIARHGQRSSGRVIDQPADRLRRCLDGELLPHVAAARSLLPLLTESGR
ncbi:MAG: SDR family NAD(P)-dependent oxidoreductase, partial [Rudaea sp.]